MSNIELSGKISGLTTELSDLERPLCITKDYAVMAFYLRLMDKWDELLADLNRLHNNEDAKTNPKIHPTVLHAREFNCLLKIIRLMHRSARKTNSRHLIAWISSVPTVMPLRPCSFSLISLNRSWFKGFYNLPYRALNLADVGLFRGFRFPKGSFFFPSPPIGHF